MLDLVIIGAEPWGRRLRTRQRRPASRTLVIEKGLIGNTIYNYPVGLTVFSTVNELEFNDGEAQPAREKPTREELLSYYVRFVLDNELNVNAEEKVLALHKTRLGFRVTSDKGVYDAVRSVSAIVPWTILKAERPW